MAKVILKAMRLFRCTAVLLLRTMALGVLGAPSADAHSPSSSRLFLDLTDRGVLTVDMALMDLSQAVSLDLDRDGSVTWGELESSRDRLAAFVSEGVKLTRGGSACSLTLEDRALSLIEHSGIRHLRIDLGVSCPAAAAGTSYLLRYDLFFGMNPAHRAVLKVHSPTFDGAHVLSPANAEVGWSDDRSALASAAGFVGAGVDHILSGYDHLVFVALLIMPAAGGGAMRQKMLRVALIVTAFTIAHSITLAAATADIVRLPSRPVEIGIGASIVLAAGMNIARPSHSLSWRIAFAFGLLHGFGFAGALQEMNVARGTLLVALIGFNAGVELGQLLVVAIALPLLALVSASAHYRSVIVPAVSLAGAALGVAWTAARL